MTCSLCSSSKRCGIVFTFVALVVVVFFVLPEESWEMIHESKSMAALSSSANKKIASPSSTLKDEDDKRGEESPHQQPLLPLCSREELRVGKWEQVTLPEAPYIPQSDEDAKVSSCYNRREDFAPGQPWSSYEWQVQNVSENKCRFDRWSREEFCHLGKAIGDRLARITAISGKNEMARTATYAVVGDSLSFEHFSSLVMLLGEKSNEDDQMKTYYNKTLFHAQTACNNSWNLVYKRGDYLETVPHVVENYHPNILVINRGAHYVPDDRLLMEMNTTLNYLKEWQHDCSTSSRNDVCWVIYRTTVPGHPNCSLFSKPVNDIEQMERLIQNKSFYKGGRGETFHWWDIQSQNRLMLAALASSGLDYQVMDAYELNVRRPDLHRGKDCLHSCYPGKMDVYNRLLLHLLKDKLALTEIG